MTYKNKMTIAAQTVALALALNLFLIGNTGLACACGCSVFDVGTSSMLPNETGGMAFLEYDYQDQTHNFSGTSRAPSANNSDKEIRTHFITAGLQYIFNRSWGLQVQAPYDNRFFKSGSGSDTASTNWSEFGDIRINGIYTGFSPDLSAGVTFGLKLPTGDYKHDGADRDTQLGTGSTDILLGGFYRHALARRFVWFAQADLDQPVFTQDGYRPGTELDAAVGTYYEGWRVGRVNIRPVAQVIVSARTRDTGRNSADPVASGYQRLLLSPGIEFDMHPVSIYADVEIPVYQDVTGNQLVASALFKVIVSYHF